MTENTTVRVKKETRDKIKGLKQEGQSYDDILGEMINSHIWLQRKGPDKYEELSNTCITVSLYAQGHGELAEISFGIETLARAETHELVNRITDMFVNDFCRVSDTLCLLVIKDPVRGEIQHDWYHHYDEMPANAVHGLLLEEVMTGIHWWRDLGWDDD